MSTRLEAFIPDTDPMYQKMKKVYLACEEAEIELPQAAAEYFGSKYTEDGLLEKKLRFVLEYGTHYKEYNGDMVEGFEVYISKLPKDIDSIRFTNNY